MLLFFRGLCRLLIEAMHVYSLMHATHTRTPNMHVQHAHIHVIGVNMLERYLHIPARVCVCVGLIRDDDATCQDTHASHQQLLL